MADNPPDGKTNFAGKLLWLVPAGMVVLLAMVLQAALKIEPKAPDVAPTVSAGDYPRTIVESSGRRVVIPARPLRIIAAEAGSADILSAIVEPSRLAAVPFTVDNYAGSQAWFAAHKEIHRFQAFNAETMLALKPDLILSAAFQDPLTFSVIEKAGIPIMKFEDFRTIAGIRGWINAVGTAIGEDEKTANLLAEFDGRLAAVEKAVAGRPKPRALAYSNYGGNGTAVGAGESADEIIRRAGGTNAAVEMNLKGHVNFSFEQMLKLNPDVIVVGGKEGFDSNQVKTLLNESSIAELKAIQQKRIAVIPSQYFGATTQYVVDAVEILAKQLHPDAFVPPPFVQGGTEGGQPGKLP